VRVALRRRRARVDIDAPADLARRWSPIVPSGAGD
jgi:hypothetical protein